MAGKSTVGVQVPNREREIIWLRENIESQEFIGSKSKLTLAMGKDINGRIVVADLAGMPHLLIAGSTGTGKSVAINAMIMSILYKSTPEQVRLVLVDPKRLELGNYEGVPHLYTPIITEPKLAANALRNAVREMEKRLKLLAAKGVRNIDQYNRLFDGPNTPSLFGENSEEKPLPYIVIIIDELADLMVALSWADLTYVLPASSLGYVLLAFIAKYHLHEQITTGRWLGIALITLGVGFVAGGPHKTHGAVNSSENLQPETVPMRGGQ